MLLAIDIGNTKIKSAVFEQNTLLEYFSFAHDELEAQVNTIARKYPECKDVVVSNVRNDLEEYFQQINNSLRWSFITNQSSFPFINKYATPKSLGIDRMVLSSGAVLLYPNQHRLVIDAGTCITYDFIDQDDNYLGGAISPGIRLRYEILHQETAKLPLLQVKSPDFFIGNSTDESIHVGVIQGVLHEIEGFMQQYKAHTANIIIILTGGDADFLAKRLKNTIFANSNFLLESLNQTFQYNVNNV